MTANVRHVPVDSGGALGPYVLGRRLGAGGMGAVYESVRVSDGKRVEIKVPYCEMLDQDYAKRRFRDEGIAGGVVAHPSLARVLEYAECGAVPYLVMELVHGVRLSPYRGLPTLRRAALIVQQLLDGLAALHGADIIHGDVKTDNVLIGHDGDVKLIDFGLAHVHGETPTTRIVSGTPDYMAPEVIRGEGSTPASDTYACGVILYELVTGSTPFGGGTSAEIVRRHLTEQVVPPSLRRADIEIPAILERIIMRALEKDPAKRFTTATAFADALAVALPCLDNSVTTPRRHARRGMRTVKRVPRGPVSSVIVPPCNDTRECTIDMPSPVPPSFVEKNGS